MKKWNLYSLTCFLSLHLGFFNIAHASRMFDEKLPYLDPIPPVSANQSERYLTCPIANAPSHIFSWRGENVAYSSNRDPSYTKEGWGQRVSNRWNNGLAGIVPNKKNTQVTAIDIRQFNNKRFYLYLGNNEQFYKPFEPLSSSKFIVTLNLAKKIREESAKKYGPSRSFGLNSYIDFNETWGQNRHLGELITWQHSYEKDSDETGSISNQISQWFGGLGVRSKLNDLIGSWLLRPSYEVLKAGYGQAQNFSSAEVRTEDGRFVKIDPYYDTSDGSKNLSTVSLAEILRRTIEFDALKNDGVSDIAFPGITREDVLTLLYGAPSEVQGGMQKGIGIYLTEALGGKDNLDAKTNGEWRIFTKIGLGSSVDFVVTAAVCLPHYEGGRAFVISAHTKGTNYEKEDAYMYDVIKSVTDAIVPGFRPSVGTQDAQARQY